MKRSKKKSTEQYARLESRELLAGIQFDATTGIVSIEGTAQEDVVRAVVINGTDLRFTMEGVETKTFGLDEVTQIVFFGLAGDDFFRNDTPVSLSANGGLGDDEIYGGSGDDQIAGGDGENRLFGGDGDDSLYGGADRDELRGGAGNDVLVGGDEDDLLIGDSGDDLLLGNGGDDKLFGNRGHDDLFGHEGRDELVGGDGADQLYGGDDDDTLQGGQGFDELRGDAGNDWLSGGTENDQVYGGDGNDRSFGDSGDDLLIDDLGDDRLFGREGNDFLAGGRGADQLFGDEGDDTLIGGSENDLLSGGDGDDGIYGNDGDDDLYGGTGGDRIAGADGNDLLVGGSEDDRLVAGNGDDIVLAGAGRDFILGGSGNDFIRGDEGDDTVYAGDGNDRVRGSSGDDHLFGQAGNDYINGDLDRDVVYGGPGVDTVDGGAGDDDVRGDKDDLVLTDDEDGDEDDDHRYGTGRPLGLSNRLTISFAPDGTSVFDQSSELFTAFAGSVSDQEIRDSVFTSFNLWAANGNLDVGLVNDSGDPFGTPGKSYGDTRFGDVRIGAIDLPADVNAIALGQGDFIAGTWGGDILFNSNAQFDSIEEFFAVALHEVGHVLGLEHTPDLGSVMHRYSKRTTLAPQDILAFQQLYGNRALDPNEVIENSNDSTDDATRIRLFGESLDGEVPTILFGDISNNNDVDYFEYRKPSGYSGTATFTLTSETISQFDGKLTVFDDSGTVVDQVTMDSTYGDTITVTIPALAGASQYYVRVEADSIDSRGRFALITTLDDRNTITNSLAVATAQHSAFSDWDAEDIAEYFETGEGYLFNDDLSANDQFENATELETEDGFELAMRFEYAASLSSASDVDYYQFESVEFEGVAPTMNISVRATEYGGMIPKVTVLDDEGNSIPSQVAVNGRGETTIQVTEYQSDRNYYLRIESDDLIAFNDGNYQLAISHSDESLQFQTLGAGVMDSVTSRFHSIHVAESQVFQFALEATMNSVQRPIIWATIFDESGDIVYQGATRNGERRTTDATLLAAGSYVVRIDAAPNATFTNLSYQFLGVDVSDSQGPKFSDPSTSPFETNGNGGYVYPDNVVKDSSFVVVDGVSSNQTTPPKPDPPVSLYQWYWG